MLKDTFDINFDSEWQAARRTVRALLRWEYVSPKEWQELFAIIHRICAWITGGSRLSTLNLYKEVKLHTLAIHRHLQKYEVGKILLEEYGKEWSKYYSQVEILSKPFFFVKTIRTKADLGQISIECGSYEVAKEMLVFWDEIVFEPLRSNLLSTAMCFIEAERNGIEYMSNSIVALRQSYAAMSFDERSIYKEEFEKLYIDCALKYYRIHASMMLETDGVLRYMQYADCRLQEEEIRGRRYLDPEAQSVEKLLERLVDCIIVQFEEQILAECEALLRVNNIELLQRMYRLINRTPSGMPKILKHLHHYITARAYEEMKAGAESVSNDPEKYVSQLVSVFNKFTNLVCDAFYDDPRSLTARDQAFQDVVSDTRIFKLEIKNGKDISGSRVNVQSKCPELLANFCDLILRRTIFTKKLNSEEVDTKLDDVLLILKYVTNKDIFMRFYKVHLTRRLILDISADQEKEEHMVAKMRKMGMPPEYVNKLYKMLQDVELSRDLSKLLKKKMIAKTSGLEGSVSLKVLNLGTWTRVRENMNVDVQLPNELEEFLPEIEDFYQKQHSGRRLQWFYHWSHGTISFQNEVGKYDLDVTTPQLSVLYCWNGRPFDRLSLETLRMGTKLLKADLSRTLSWLMTYPKSKDHIILSDCEENPPRFTDSSLFWLNQQFRICKNGKEINHGRVNLIGRLQLFLDGGSDEEQDDILLLRTERVKEAIIKVMKIRKRCTLGQLQTELIQLLKDTFLPSKQLFKEQIDVLLENKCIQRDLSDMNLFHYIS